MANCTFFKLFVLVVLLGAVMLHCDARGGRGGGGRGGGGTGGAGKGGSVGGNKGGSVGGNKGGNVGGNKGGSVGGNKGGSVGGNKGGSVGGNKGGSVGGNKGGSVGGSAGGSGGKTGGDGGLSGGKTGRETGLNGKKTGEGQSQSPPTQILVQNPPRHPPKKETQIKGTENGLPKLNPVRFQINPAKLRRKSRPIEEYVNALENLLNLRDISTLTDLPVLQDLDEYLQVFRSTGRPSSELEPQSYYIYNIYVKSENHKKTIVNQVRASEIICSRLISNDEGELHLIIPADEKQSLEKAARTYSWKLEPYKFY